MVLFLLIDKSKGFIKDKESSNNVLFPCPVSSRCTMKGVPLLQPSCSTIIFLRTKEGYRSFSSSNGVGAIRSRVPLLYSKSIPTGRLMIDGSGG